MSQDIAVMNLAEAGADEHDIAYSVDVASQPAAISREQDGDEQLDGSLAPAQAPLTNANTKLTDDIDNFPSWPKSSSQKRMQGNVQSKSESPAATRPYLQPQSKASFASPKTPKRKGKGRLPCIALA